jgi:CRP/FNR family transcriptional regulator
MANPFRLVTPGGRRTVWRGLQAPRLLALEAAADSSGYPCKEEQIFADLSPMAAERLAAITSARSYPKGTVLFAEGQDPSGIFLMRKGRAQLYFRSAAGKAMHLTIAEPGDALGVPASILGKPYEIAAEAMDPVEAGFIPRRQLLDFLREHPDAAYCAARHLIGMFRWLFAEMRHVGLTHSTEERFARLLLARSANHERGPGKPRLTITSEEIGLIIGASRASVERLLRHLKKRRLLRGKGPALVIRDRAGIERLAGQS